MPELISLEQTVILGCPNNDGNMLLLLLLLLIVFLLLILIYNYINISHTILHQLFLNKFFLIMLT